MTVLGQGWYSEYQRRVVAEVGLKEQGKVTEQVQGIITSTRADAKELKDLIKAARVIGGKLVSGAKIKVPEKTDSVKHDALVTRVEDSTRIAVVNDTTSIGVLKGTIKAPPFPSALSFDYTITRPAFEPQVGFVEKGDATFAVVSWQDQQYSIKAPFARAVNHERKLVPFTTLMVDPSNSWVTQLGVRFTSKKILGFGAVGMVERTFGNDAGTKGLVGVTRDW